MSAPARSGRPASPAATADVRTHNASLVFGRIVAGHAEPPSRAQVAAATGLTRATVSALVDDLVAAGLVTDAGPAAGTGRPGRPGSPLVVAPGAPVAVGVEIDVDVLAVTALTPTGRPVRSRRVAVDLRGTEPGPVLARVVELVGSLDLPTPVAGVGVAVAGLVDPTGVLRRAPNLPRWVDVDVATTLRRALALPVAVDNDANLAALAHRAAGDRTDFVYVSGEVGVGAGLVLGGHVFHGGHGFAGEFGHVVVEPRGPQCGCGGRGCVEQYAGEVAVLRAAGVAAGPGPEARAELVARLAGGRADAAAAVAAAGTALGVALSSLINLVDVDDVVLGGFYADVVDHLLPPLAAELDLRIVAGGQRDVRVGASTLGVGAAVQGAAALVVQSLVDDPLGRVRSAR